MTVCACLVSQVEGVAGVSWNDPLQEPASRPVSSTPAQLRSSTAPFMTVIVVIGFACLLRTVMCVGEQ